MPSVATIVLTARDNASDDIARVARSLDRLQASTGKTIRLDGSGIGGVAQGMRGAEQAAARLTSTTGNLGGSLRTVASTAGSLAGVFGVAFGAQAIAGFASESVQAANSLEVTEARVKALSGSTQRYAQVLGMAKTGQQTYGGSLEQNLAALGSFVNLSNRSGVELGKLDNAARRLAAADPAQGIEGATVAMREFLTGTGAEAAISLADRFELDKDALQKLTKEGVSAKERMAGLDTLLNDMGYTNEFLAAQTNTSAKSFQDLATAFSNLKTTVGSGIASFVAPAAQQTAKDLGYITDNLSSKAQRQAEVFGNTSSYDQYAAAVGKVNSQYTGIARSVDGFFLSLNALTPAQYAATQAMVKNGMAADEAIGKVQALASTEALVTTATGARGAALQAMLPQILQAAAGSDAERIAVESAVMAYKSGQGVYASKAEADRLMNAELTALIPKQLSSAAAADAQTLANYGMTKAQQDAAYASVMARAALEDETAAALINENETRLNAQAKDELRARAEECAQAILKSGDASDATIAKFAAQYGINIDVARSFYAVAAAAKTAADAMAYAADMRNARDQMQAQEILDRQGVKLSGKKGIEQSRTDLVAQEAAQAAQALEAQKKAAADAARAAESAAKKAASGSTSAAKKAASAEASAAKKAASEEARAQAEAVREAEQLQKAQDALLSDEERLAVYRQRLAAEMPEVERLELMKQIRDLEESVTNEQEKQAKAALDAHLAAIDDRKERREEAKELAAAQRVLASTTTSEAQKAAARDVLERIPLEQEKRAQAIADKLQDAGQAAVTGGAAGAPAVPVSVQPVATAPISIAQAGLPQAGTALPSLTLNATILLPDGTTVGSGSAMTNLNNPVADLRVALRATGV